MLLPPKSVKKANNAKRNNRILSASPTSSGSEKKGVNGSNELAGPNKDEIERSIKRDGVEPPEEERMDIDDWEKKAGRVLTEEDVDEVARMVTWCFVTPFPFASDNCILRRFFRSNGTTCNTINVSWCNEYCHWRADRRGRLLGHSATPQLTVVPGIQKSLEAISRGETGRHPRPLECGQASAGSQGGNDGCSA